MKRSIGLASSCRWGPGRVRQAGLRDVCDGQRVTRTLPMDTYGPMVSTQVVEAIFSDACSFCWFLPSVMKSISVLLDVLGFHPNGTVANHTADAKLR